MMQDSVNGSSVHFQDEGDARDFAKYAKKFKAEKIKVNGRVVTWTGGTLYSGIVKIDGETIEGLVELAEFFNGFNFDFE